MKVKVRKIELPKPSPKPEFMEPYHGDILSRPDCPEDQWRFAERCPVDAPFWSVGEKLQRKYFPHPLMKVECPYHGETYLLGLKVPERFAILDTRLKFACGCSWRDGGKLSGFWSYGWTRDEDEERLDYAKGRKALVGEDGKAPKEKPPLPRPVLNKVAPRPVVAPQKAAPPKPKVVQKPSLFEG
jgi:hypothetical protein